MANLSPGLSICSANSLSILKSKFNVVLVIPSLLLSEYRLSNLSTVWGAFSISVVLNIVLSGEGKLPISHSPVKGFCDTTYPLTFHH